MCLEIKKKEERHGIGRWLVGWLILPEYHHDNFWDGDMRGDGKYYPNMRLKLQD